MLIKQRVPFACEPYQAAINMPDAKLIVTERILPLAARGEQRNIPQVDPDVNIEPPIGN
jgi:hypothetical protein